MATTEAQNLLKNLGKFKSPLEKRCQNKFYQYQKDHCHENEECLKLKIIFKKLIEHDYLDEFIHNNNQPVQDDQPTEQLVVGIRNLVVGIRSQLGKGIHELSEYCMTRGSHLSDLQIYKVYTYPMMIFLW